ncbi:transcription factor HIVEP3 [Crotalus adamanteus]|uniref:Transcription factor HIVEP3 n=1 Tax=Crotalus adamanteus TaxID=8729 RepID=A0AAW1AY34_CROAD
MLKRQPAIELPLGMEYSSEEVGAAGKESFSRPPEEQETKESELTKKSRKGTKIKGFMYECNICGARYKKRDNYEAHKKYYCSELQISKPHSSSSYTLSEMEKGLMESDPGPQVMHYKLGTSLELTPLRKRRKEKSLGDDEDPPAFELTEASFSGSGPATQFMGLKSSDVALKLISKSVKPAMEPAQPMPLSESQLALQLPSDIGAHLPHLKSSLSPEIGSRTFSPSIDYGSESRLHILARPSSPSASISISQLVVPACSEPVVSLVVPVRIQANMPSYGSAMYTTLSQILVTQSHCSTSSILLPKFEDYQTMGTLVCTANVHSVGLDLAQMITEQQKTLIHSPYLRLPLSLSERKGYFPLGPMSESVLDLEESPSNAGGSKRMLSPAGSLELTMETQQQKRVKEEEFFETEEKLEIVMTSNTMEEGKKCDQTAAKAETLPDILSEQSESPKGQAALNLVLPQSEASSFEVQKECKQPARKKPESNHAPEKVKKEDLKESAEALVANPLSSACSSVAAQSSKKSQDSTDVKKVHLPSLLPSEGQKDAMQTSKERDKRGKTEDDIHVTKRGEPTRIKIFEGG